MSDWFLCIFSAVGILILLCSVMPWLLLAFTPVVVMYVLIHRFYVSSCRELGRLQSMTRSPIFSQYGEILEGKNNAHIAAIRRGLQCTVCQRWVGGNDCG